ncbi:MAG: hypothetical protein ACYDG2_01370 [Ruminiclostridium sp.]
MKELIRHIKAIRNQFKINTYTLIQCEVCNSRDVAFGEVEKDDNGAISYPVVCRKCGAMGIVCEKWWSKEEREES